MAMFDDPKKELKKLEAQLLKEEEWFDKELEMAKALIGDEPAPKQRKKPVQKPMQETQVYRTPETGASKQSGKKPQKKEPAPKKKSNRGLVILACLETLGIVGVVAYWLLFLL